MKNIGTFVLIIFVEEILIVHMLKNFHIEFIHGPLTLDELHFANSLTLLTILLSRSFQCTESHFNYLKNTTWLVCRL